MTFLDDGPAQGQCLTLARSPIFLRVTELKGKWDALDLLEDTPTPEEKLYAYKRHGEVGVAFIDGVDPKTKRRRGWREVIAHYKLAPEQPTDEQMRNTMLWHQWCQTQKDNQP